MTDGLVINGARYPVPGVRVITYLDDPARCPRVTKGNARLASATTAVMLHTSRGRSGVIVPGSRESDKAAKLVRYQVRTERAASWCITIGSAGDVWQQCDAATFATWHATVANSWSVGLEMAQSADTPDLTQAQVDACVAVVRVLCDALRIPLQLPAVGGAPVNGVVRAWQSRKQGGDARAAAGVLGHRNVTTSRGKGDPGDGIFRALLGAGFAGVAPDAMTVHTLRAPAAVMAPEAPGLDAVEEPHDEDAPAWPPLPAWIDPALEVDASEDLPDDLAAFARAQAPVLAALGVTGDRAAELIAHAATECGRGRRAFGSNYFGRKLRQDESDEHKRKHGVGLGWWRDFGHVESGDDEVEYYRTFESRDEAWRFALKRYAPRGAPRSERYAVAGDALWSDDPAGWLPAIIASGYRGTVRAAEIAALSDPSTHPSVVAHRRLVARVKELIA